MNYKQGLKKIQEMNVAGGVGGMFGYGGAGADIGSHGGSFGNSDFYAPGDARIPTSIYGGKIMTRAGMTGSKKKKKTKKKKKAYKEAFEHVISEAQCDENTLLKCLIYTENAEYNNIICNLFDSNNVVYQHEDNHILCEGTDDTVQYLLKKIENILTVEAFEQGEICAFICEMDVEFVKPKKQREEYDQKELKKGIEVEKEHTSNEEAATIIAMNHLDEMPDYYSKLEKIEKGTHG